MRLAAKLILLFLSGLLLIVGVFAFLSYQREQALAIAEHQRYAAELAKLSLRSQLSQEEQPRPSTTTTTVRIRRVELSSQDVGRLPRVPVERITLSEEISTFTMTDPSGRQTLYTYIPLDELEDSDSGANNANGSTRLEVSVPDERATTIVHQAWISSLIALGSVAGLSSLVILLGGFTMVGRPLRKLTDKVNRVAEGDFDHDLELNTRDELSTLANAINEMCRKLADQRSRIEEETNARVNVVEQLRHADRLRSVGRIAAGVAHEIGTPLNVVSGYAELIAGEDLSDEELRRSAAAIKSESDRIKLIISRLLDFARRTKPQRNPIDLGDLVQRTIQLLRSIAKSQRVELHVTVPEVAVMADVDESQIQQVLINLINNACQAKNTANVWVSVDREGGQADAPCSITVRDDGEGISSDNLGQIFEPFFTTKEVGKGTGLGLSITHGIVEEHGGTIEVDSVEGQGATFTIRLAASDSSHSTHRGEPIDE